MLLAPVYRSGRPTLCSDKVFVTVYMEVFNKQGTRWDVAEKLGYANAASIDARANALRRRGVQLPYFSTKAATDVGSLNAIIFS